MESTTNSEVLLLASRFQDASYLYGKLYLRNPTSEVPTDTSIPQAATLTLLVHDWLMFLDREVENIWRKNWNAGKILFIVTRYGPLLDMLTTATIHVAPHGAIDDNTCVVLYKISTWSSFLAMSISECILLLRTQAIYSGSARVMIPLSAAFVIGLVAGIVITWRAIRTTFFGPPPGVLLRACYLVQLDGLIFFDFVILLVIELAIVILAVRKGYNDFNSGTPLLRVLYRDSVAFFLVLFVLTLFTILVSAYAPSEYSGATASFTRVGHSIVCCRILLNLKRAATWRSDLPEMPTCSIAFAAPPRQRTDQTEMSRLEVSGTRSDEDGHHLHADGNLSQDRHRPTGESEFRDDSMYNVAR